MELTFTNQSNIPLAMAVWLATDEYDSVDLENYISATSLLKSVRQLVLERRLTPATERKLDVAGMVKSRIGTAIHNSIEASWVSEGQREAALRSLGYSEETRKRIVVNPEGEVPAGKIPVYLEQRATRELEGYVIGGKFDLVADGIINDVKTTSIWTFMSGANDWKYSMQGSIYRWLNPEIVNKDYMYIQFVLLDWKVGEYKAKQNSGYPDSDVQPHRINLVSLPETEVYLRDKLKAITELKDADEASLPLCSQMDLWQDRPTFKYYKNPQKMLKSTKNFQTHAEAHIRFIEDGQVGIIMEAPGMCRACKYCKSFMLCTQKDSLIAQGLLQL